MLFLLGPMAQPFTYPSANVRSQFRHNPCNDSIPRFGTMPKSRVAPRFNMKRPAKTPRQDPATEDACSAEDADYFEKSFDDRLKDFKTFAYGGGTTVAKSPDQLECVLKKHFTDAEMSNWWNKLSRDRRDPTFQSNMDTIVGASTGSAAKAKRGVLALRFADPTNFRELVGEQSTLVSTLDENSKGGRWLSRGQLHQQMGAEEAERKIAKGKFDMRYDSDSNSEFRLRFEEEKNKAVGTTTTTGVRHVTEGKSEDYGTLRKALQAKHADLVAREFGQKGDATHVPKRQRPKRRPKIVRRREDPTLAVRAQGSPESRSREGKAR